MGASLQRRAGLKRLLRRFTRERSGSAAVEFAFIAFPFLALIFAIVQTSLALFATQVLQAQTANAARDIMTGGAKTWDRQTFRKAVCDDAFLFKCDKLGIEVRSSQTFGTADSSPISAECAAPVDPKKLDAKVENSCYSSGGSKEVMIVRVTYQWPFGVDLTAEDRIMTIAATVAFLNEPFP